MAGIYLTFHALTLRKYLNKNADIVFRGYPILGHHSVVSPKMNIPISHMTPFFIAESFSKDKGGLRLKEKTFAKVLILFFKRKT